MRGHKRDGHPWYPSVTSADTRKIMRLLHSGPLSIRDIEDDVLREKDHPWDSRKPSKNALQLAFFGGMATVSEREGMLKTYELTARHFGWQKPPKPGSDADRTSYLLDRAVRSQGIVSLDSICHLDAPSKRAVRREIELRTRREGLVPVAIEGAGKQEHWAQPEWLDRPPEGDPALVHILSLFDPLVIQRKRSALSSATATVSRHILRRRSGCSATSRCRSSSATTLSRRSI
jgi:uncharacterized protein